MEVGFSRDCNPTLCNNGWFAGSLQPIHRCWKVGISSVFLALVPTLAGIFGPASALSQATPIGSSCKAQSPGGPLFITDNCQDPLLDKPYIDDRKPGSITDPTSGMTVSFTYVHGGFNGTSARFAFYFPVAEKYRDRFFETTYPTIGEEDAAPGCPEIGTSACSVVFALSNGAYVVSSNNAGGVPAGGALAAYRTNAAAANYSRVIAREMYRTSTRPRGYIYGASGGGYQTVGSMENTSGVWDGAVPMVFGVPNAIPNFMASQLLAMRVLRDKLPQIADAVAPGGSENLYADLSSEQQTILKEVTRLGFPPRGWWQYATMTGGGFWAVEGVARAIDPSYVEDFWSRPDYEGAEPSVHAARVRQQATVTRIAGENELLLSDLPAGDLLNAELVILDGPKAGQSVVITGVNQNKVKVVSAAGITAGTAVRLDNSWSIALQYYARHQVPTPREYAWDQYLGRDDAPLFPQRKMVIGPMLNASSAGSVANGHFHGKMIMVESVLDIMAYPWSADWYRQQAQNVRGKDISGDYRLWYMDNADHGPDLSGYTAGVAFEHAAIASDHIVGYLGEVQQALLDLDAWVAKGIPPPASTNYRMDNENQVQLADTAELRHGVQPVVTLTAITKSHSSSRVDVASGRTLTFRAKAQTPPSAGKIVKLEWDFEGDGQFTKTPIRSGRQVSLDQKHRFTKPGTYFPVVRVTAQREGDPNTPFGLIQNLASIRVVVR